MQFVRSLLILLAFSGRIYAQADSQPQPTVQFEPVSRRIVPLQDGSGRNLIIEQVKPPVFPPPPVVPTPASLNLAAWEARRAARESEAKKERRMISLTGIAYPNGQTFL